MNFLQNLAKVPLLQNLIFGLPKMTLKVGNKCNKKFSHWQTVSKTVFCYTRYCIISFWVRKLPPLINKYDLKKWPMIFCKNGSLCLFEVQKFLYKISALGIYKFVHQISCESHFRTSWGTSLKSTKHGSRTWDEMSSNSHIFF